MIDRELLGRIESHLRVLYPAGDPASLAPEVAAAVGIGPDTEPGQPVPWTERDVVLITYGDSVLDDELSPLQALERFVASELESAVSAVHILPFAPYSSDRGFSVIDYLAVDPELGTWDDIDAIGNRVELMMDLVVNHASASSDWFQAFCGGDPERHDFFVTVEGDPDLSTVVRPRSLPLLHTFDTVRGPEQVWTTFSADQVDLNYENPNVLLAMLRVIDTYCAHRARLLRLDAIGYLWKEIGSSCLHLPQTHEFVKLLRTLLEVRSPETLIITETNVPHRDNVSYFGAGDEAHLVYNFSLAPLVVHATTTGHTEPLFRWLRDLERPPPGCTYFNFLASHDGIGLRPAEGLLTTEQIAALVEAAAAAGGTHGTYDSAHGPRPYELNVSLVDLFGGDEHLVARFVCAHAIMLCTPGVPAIYVNSLLATSNDLDRMRATEVRREINRPSIPLDDIGGFSGDRRRIFDELRDLLELRRSLAVLHPDAEMHPRDVRSGIVAIERSRDGDTLLALHNVRTEPLVVDLDGTWFDHVAGDTRTSPFLIAPFQVMWLTPSAD